MEIPGRPQDSSKAASGMKEAEATPPFPQGAVRPLPRVRHPASSTYYRSQSRTRCSPRRAQHVSLPEQAGASQQQSEGAEMYQSSLSSRASGAHLTEPNQKVPGDPPADSAAGPQVLTSLSPIRRYWGTCQKTFMFTTAASWRPRAPQCITAASAAGARMSPSRKSCRRRHSTAAEASMAATHTRRPQPAEPSR